MKFEATRDHGKSNLGWRRKIDYGREHHNRAKHPNLVQNMFNVPANAC